MRIRNVVIGAALAVSLIGGAPAIAADDDATPRGHHVKFVHRMGPSVEHAAMQNIVADALSAKTGRSAVEIKTMLEDDPPHEVAKDLGLSEADMKGLFKQSRETLIQRASAAGLITAEQAAELRKAAPMHDRMYKRPGRDGLPPLDDEG
jgi:hypothetical protein